MQAEELFKAFADKSRLRIITLLTKGPKFVEQLALELNISVSTVSFHLKKLQQTHIVSVKKEQYYSVYFIEDEVLKMTIKSIIDSNDTKAQDVFYEQVLNECFKNGRVEKLPKQVRKREVICKEIAKRFKPKIGYTIGEANVLIADVVENFTEIKNQMFKLNLIYEKKGKIYRSP